MKERKVNAKEELLAAHVKPYVWKGEGTVYASASVKYNLLDQLELLETSGKHISIVPMNSTVDEHLFQVVTIGLELSNFIEIIKSFKALGATKQEYILKSYYDADKLQPGQDIFELKITVEDDIFYNIKQLKWVPSDEGTCIAKWIE